MKIISQEEVQRALKYPEFIFDLKDAYGRSYTMPPRNVFLLDDDGSSNDAFALLPSWNEEVIAVKSFTYLPGNKSPYKILYSKILLFDRKHGEPLALVDGTSCTYYRTAGVSALASLFLSRENSETLLLLGAGNLAPFIMKAHASVRPIKKIMLFDRTPSKAESMIDQISSQLPGIKFSVPNDIQSGCMEADIIVSATSSHDILVYGDWVKEGTHTDFIGNHHADKRECDTSLILKSKVYVDTYVNCFKEAGEVIIPIEEGVFSKDEVVGELAELCTDSVPKRQSDSEITLFKAVGNALSDLVAAYQTYKST
jgi:1-pyrroline-2-carboxylate reductase [NAD(P)H]